MQETCGVQGERLDLGRMRAVTISISEICSARRAVIRAAQHLSAAKILMGMVGIVLIIACAK